MDEQNVKVNDAKESSTLRSITNVYKWIGAISIFIGLFLLFISVFPASHGEKVTSEPLIGGVALFEGLFSLFAAYVGEAIDDIRNNTKK